MHLLFLWCGLPGGRQAQVGSSFCVIPKMDRELKKGAGDLRAMVQGLGRGGADNYKCKCTTWRHEGDRVEELKQMAWAQDIGGAGEC